MGNGMFSTATSWMQSANDALPIGELEYSGHDTHDADPLTVLYLPAREQEKNKTWLRLEKKEKQLAS